MNDLKMMRDQIAESLQYGQQLIRNTTKNPLMLMEKERVQSTKIREILNNSEIKYINCFAREREIPGQMLKEYIDSLNNKQI